MTIVRHIEKKISDLETKLVQDLVLSKVPFYGANRERLEGIFKSNVFRSEVSQYSGFNRKFKFIVSPFHGPRCMASENIYWLVELSFGHAAKSLRDNINIVDFEATIDHRTLSSLEAEKLYMPLECIFKHDTQYQPSAIWVDDFYTMLALHSDAHLHRVEFNYNYVGWSPKEFHTPLDANNRLAY